jgi:glycosyltransferase involved in cell wall biosynthesis
VASTIFKKNMFFSIYRNFNVGLWFWEIENPPKEWALFNQWTDEIWVQTDFVYKIFKKLSPNVYKIPFSIDVKWNKNKNRSYFNLPEKKFIFLFTFDFWSCYVRKNPEAVITAFKKAFSRRNDVFLLIKTTHGEDLQDDMSRLISVIGDAPNIELRNIFISDEDQYSLLNVCSAYISLHRSEGLGLGLAEAMFLGKPVIATNYSGNLEFMSKKNSCLVNYSLIPIERNISYPYPYTADKFWAEPDIKHAAYLMRKVKESHTFRNKIKRQAFHDMKFYNFENLQKAILYRVNKITK